MNGLMEPIKPPLKPIRPLRHTSLVPRLSLRSVFGHALVILVGVAVLWKGGKGLEVTWLLPPLALVGALSLWVHSKKNGVPPVAWPAWLAAILFCLWTVLSFLFSETRNYGLDEVLRDVSLALLWLQLLRLAPAPREALAGRIIDALVYACLFAVLIGLVVYVAQPVSRFVGTFFDPRYHTDYWPNAWAELVLLVWPLLLWKALQAEGRRRMVWLVLTGCVVGALFLSYSRGGFIAFVGQVLLLAGLFAWLTPRKQRSVRSSAVLSAVVMATAVVFFIGGNALRSTLYSVQDLGAKVTFTADEGTSSIDERRDFWAQAWSLSLQKPLFGHGPYSFRFLQPRLQEMVYATSDHAHNLWLKLAMERGWPTAIFWTVMAMFSLWLAVRRTSKERELGWPALAALGAVGVLAHVLIDFNLQFVGVALPLWLLFGLMAAPAHWPKPPRFVASAQMVIELLAVLLLTCVAVREAAYLVTSSLGRKAEARGDLVTAQSWYEVSADSWFPRDLQLGSAGIALQQKQLPAALAALEAYIGENAQDARAFSLRAAVAEQAGSYVAAARDLERAFVWSKYNDLKVLRRWIGVSQLDTNTLPPPAAEAQTVIRAFEAAFMQNSHFILLGDNVEEFSTICWMQEKTNELDLRDFCRENLPAVTAAAKEVRANLDARKRGRLW